MWKYSVGVGWWYRKEKKTMKGNFRFKPLHCSGLYSSFPWKQPTCPYLMENHYWDSSRECIQQQTCISLINNSICHVCIVEHLSWIRFWHCCNLLWVSHFASVDLTDELLTGKFRAFKNLELPSQIYSVRVPADLHAHAPAAEEFQRSSPWVKTHVNLDICSRTHTHRAVTECLRL